MAGGRFVVAVVAIDEAGTSAIGPCLFFFKPNIRAFEAVVVCLDKLVARELRTRAHRQIHVLLNPIRDGFRIFQTVRMMRRTIFDHDGNPSAELMITILNGQRVALK